MPLKPTCCLTLPISPRMRATSLRPIWWISSGGMSVVVEFRALNAYQASPSGRPSMRGLRGSSPGTRRQ